jgi:predicted dehydrogenase
VRTGPSDTGARNSWREICERASLGIASTANIGATVVGATKGSEVTDFVAVASRDDRRAREFADGIGLVESFGSYEALLESDGVDAIYVALPPAMHTEWTVKALGAGKHVLCEKPFALTAADAERAFDAADRHRTSTPTGR